jgi:hypothetical protein
MPQLRLRDERSRRTKWLPLCLAASSAVEGALPLYTPLPLTAIPHKEAWGRPPWGALSDPLKVWGIRSLDLAFDALPKENPVTNSRRGLSRDEAAMYIGILGREIRRDGCRWQKSLERKMAMGPRRSTQAGVDPSAR